MSNRQFPIALVAAAMAVPLAGAALAGSHERQKIDCEGVMHEGAPASIAVALFVPGTAPG